jgi:hypothetical protein
MISFQSNPGRATLSGGSDAGDKTGIGHGQEYFIDG